MSDNKSSKSAGRVLLPDYVVPTKYDLKITPDLVNYTFDGVVTIDMTTSSDVDSKQITLHAKELLFKSASFQVSGDDNKTITAEEVRKTDPSIYVSIHLSDVCVYFSHALFRFAFSLRRSIYLSIYLCTVLNCRFTSISKPRRRPFSLEKPCQRVAPLL